ncbi:hypothetical protein [Moorena sp. SIO4G3]|uniref:hypothetical protein n=1 Tax=Moorena sp. SIO4G3 TaxID=2607821 RepID=UPI0014291E4F|nr:hypothetical protein [Moorena sp. SIO4G3]NEO77934.1 hypothetical protein [Moorena sp. SIO4G3]
MFEIKNLAIATFARGLMIMQRKYDKQLYKAQHLIDNFFPKIKQYLAMAKPVTIKLREIS